MRALASLTKSPWRECRANLIKFTRFTFFFLGSVSAYPGNFVCRSCKLMCIKYNINNYQKKKKERNKLRAKCPEWVVSNHSCSVLSTSHTIVHLMCILTQFVCFLCKKKVSILQADILEHGYVFF